MMCSADINNLEASICSQLEEIGRNYEDDLANHYADLGFRNLSEYIRGKAEGMREAIELIHEMFEIHKSL